MLHNKLVQSRVQTSFNIFYFLAHVYIIQAHCANTGYGIDRSMKRIDSINTMYHIRLLFTPSYELRCRTVLAS